MKEKEKQGQGIRLMVDNNKCKIKRTIKQIIPVVTIPKLIIKGTHILLDILYRTTRKIAISTPKSRKTDIDGMRLALRNHAQSFIVIIKKREQRKDVNCHRPRLYTMH